MKVVIVQGNPPTPVESPREIGNIAVKFPISCMEIIRLAPFVTANVEGQPSRGVKELYDTVNAELPLW